MYVPDELKVNRFSDAKIPSNKDYFARVGRQALPAGQYTGDEAAMMPTDKVSQISQAELDLYDQMMQDAENSKPEGNE